MIYKAPFNPIHLGFVCLMKSATTGNGLRPHQSPPKNRHTELVFGKKILGQSLLTNQVLYMVI